MDRPNWTSPLANEDSNIRTGPLLALPVATDTRARDGIPVCITANASNDRARRNSIRLALFVVLDVKSFN